MSSGICVDLPLVLNPYTGTIGGFIGLLADRSSQRASLDGLNGAAIAGWAGLPAAGPKP
jgi:hypothetical protein